MTLYKWSRTAANNATADSTSPWPEGMAPSAVDDSARGMMAAAAKFRDDISGAIVTTGTSTAYTVSSYQVFDSLSDMDGKMIAFSPHTTNGAGQVTLNVDSLGAKPIRTAPSVDLISGTIIQGTPYLVVYNNSDGAFYLHGFFGNPYNVPLGASLNYWGATTPNSSFAFPVGQAISRTTYASLFSLISTTYGAGDGSTTFNLPDVRGRVIAAIDNLGGNSANRLLNGSMSGGRNSLGAGGGADTHTLAAAEIPGISFSGSGSVSVTSNDTNMVKGNLAVAGLAAGGNSVQVFSGTSGSSVQETSTGSTTVSGSSTNTSGQPHDNLQPTVLASHIMRII